MSCCAPALRDLVVVAVVLVAIRWCLSGRQLWSSITITLINYQVKVFPTHAVEFEVLRRLRALALS